jgi:hypothetical protein
MRTWHFYRLSDGTFDGRSYTTSDYSSLAQNIPSGFGAYEGVKDWRTQRVRDGRLIDYIPPKPTDDHEWDVAAKRWVLKRAIQERTARQAKAREQIEALERKMARPLSELLSPTSDDATKAIAQQKLAELTAERDRIAIESGLRQSAQ